MMKKMTTFAASAAIAATFVATGANASENPFGMQELSAGYDVAMSTSEGMCGEGKCGGDKGKEGKCGEDKSGGDKGKEGKCGEGKCGGDKAK